MTQATRDRLFGWQTAFDHPLTLGMTAGLVLLLIAVPFVFRFLSRSGKIDTHLRTELYRRYYSWLVLIPAILIPILLGAAWMIVGIGILSLFCYREFARATGLFRHRLISLVIVLGIGLMTFSILDNWYRLFVAVTPLVVSLIAAVALCEDQPKGYIQRVALGVLAFLLFGTCLGHLSYLANDSLYRPIVILVFIAVEMNDVFAYVVGKSFGKHRLAPNTSPKKTIEGSLGAIFLTSLLVVSLGSFLYPVEKLQAHGMQPHHELILLAIFGMMISVVGQLGDLVLSSIKRDLGIKDMATFIPGHGGLLDRFDSLILVSPAVFHFANYAAGVGIDQTVRIFSG